ncbi:MAG: SMP-30/gluconolactonase/LRE family protein [Burkholderiaceae bacterium]
MNWTPVADSVSLLGESPRWDDRRQCLFWCDIDGRRIGRLDSKGTVNFWPVHAEPGCLALTDAGWLMVAVRDGLYRFDPHDAHWQMLVPAPYDATVQRFNDGACDRQGRFWVGTMFEPRDRPAARLYRASPSSGGWRLSDQAGDVVTANGLAFTRDGQAARWADTRGHRIDSFELDAGSGALSGRRIWASFDALPAPPAPQYGGRPDGACLDVDGGYWVAMYEGGRIVRLDEQGRVTDSVSVPVRCPTMVAFGGPDLRTMYVTSARHGRPEAELRSQPLAGALWRAPAPVAGLAVTRVATT